MVKSLKSNENQIKQKPWHKPVLWPYWFLKSWFNLLKKKKASFFPSQRSCHFLQGILLVLFFKIILLLISFWLLYMNLSCFFLLYFSGKFWRQTHKKKFSSRLAAVRLVYGIDFIQPIFVPHGLACAWVALVTYKCLIDTMTRVKPRVCPKFSFLTATI